MKTHSNSDGFSMLEILAALALAGLILAGLFHNTVQLQRSVQRNAERIRTGHTAASIAAWWRRLPPSQRFAKDFSDFTRVPRETGLRNVSEFVWRIETDQQGVTYLSVKGPVSQPVRLPVALRE